MGGVGVAGRDVGVGNGIAAVGDAAGVAIAGRGGGVGARRGAAVGKVDAGAGVGTELGARLGGEAATDTGVAAGKGANSSSIGAPAPTMMTPPHTEQRARTPPDGTFVELSGAEFDLLLAFVSSPQRVIGRERLLEMSRARFSDASDRSIDVLVSTLRRKLAMTGQAEALLRTVRGVCYLFTAPVERR